MSMYWVDWGGGGCDAPSEGELRRERLPCSSSLSRSFRSCSAFSWRMSRKDMCGGRPDWLRLPLLELLRLGREAPVEVEAAEAGAGAGAGAVEPSFSPFNEEEEEGSAAKMPAKRPPVRLAKGFQLFLRSRRSSARERGEGWSSEDAPLLMCVCPGVVERRGGKKQTQLLFAVS